jgi:hypothetical protein
MAAGFNSEGVCYLTVGEALNARCGAVSSVLADGSVMACSGVSNLTATGADLSYQKISPAGVTSYQLVPVAPMPCEKPTWADSYTPLIGQYTLLLLALLGLKVLIGMFKHDNLPS